MMFLRTNLGRSMHQRSKIHLPTHFDLHGHDIQPPWHSYLLFVVPVVLLVLVVRHIQQQPFSSSQIHNTSVTPHLAPTLLYAASNRATPASYDLESYYSHTYIYFVLLSYQTEMDLFHCASLKHDLNVYYVHLSDYSYAIPITPVSYLLSIVFH